MVLGSERDYHPRSGMDTISEIRRELDDDPSRYDNRSLPQQRAVPEDRQHYVNTSSQNREDEGFSKKQIDFMREFFVEQMKDAISVAVQNMSYMS